MFVRCGDKIVVDVLFLLFLARDGGMKKKGGQEKRGYMIYWLNFFFIPTVLGFPCSGFANQEFAGTDEIQSFCKYVFILPCCPQTPMLNCFSSLSSLLSSPTFKWKRIEGKTIAYRILTVNNRLNYGVSFPVLKRVEVNGANAEPLYEYLKSEKPGLMGMKRMFVPPPPSFPLFSHWWIILCFVQSFCMLVYAFILTLSPTFFVFKKQSMELHKVSLWQKRQRLC